MDSTTLLQLVASYGYVVLFLLAVAEGPLVAMLAGVLVGLQLLDGLLVYLLLVTADLVGDSMHYGLGYWGRHAALARIRGWLGITDTRVAQVERLLGSHGASTLITGKLTHVLGAPLLVAAGLVRMRFGHLLVYNLIGTLPKSAFFMLLGVYYGTHVQRVQRYLNLGSVAVLVVVPIGVALYVLSIRYVASKHFKEQ